MTYPVLVVLPPNPTDGPHLFVVILNIGHKLLRTRFFLGGGGR